MRPRRAGSSRRPSGFSLVELSLVLAIVALVAGALIVGRDMVRNAALRAITEEQQEIEAALHAFRLRYDAWPGDYAGASATWGPDAHDGDQDTVITINVDVTGEYLYLWEHLGHAGLIRGKYTGVPNVPTPTIAYLEPGINIPPTRYDPTSGYVVWDNTQNAEAGAIWPCHEAARSKCLILAARQYPPNSVWAFLSGAISPSDAKAVDAKLDDGHAFRGSVRALTGLTRDLVTLYAPHDCSDSVFNPAPSADYNLTSSKPACLLIVTLER